MFFPKYAFYYFARKAFFDFFFGGGVGGWGGGERGDFHNPKPLNFHAVYGSFQFALT